MTGVDFLTQRVEAKMHRSMVLVGLVFGGLVGLPILAHAACDDLKPENVQEIDGKKYLNIAGEWDSSIEMGRLEDSNTLEITVDGLNFRGEKLERDSSRFVRRGDTLISGRLLEGCEIEAQIRVRRETLSVDDIEIADGGKELYFERETVRATLELTLERN
jgi:hypothetical protein